MLCEKVFAREVVEKVSELEKEKMKTGKAFHDFLPSGVVRDLKKNNVAASQFSCVTIFYGEILDFDDLIKDCSASEVINSNNDGTKTEINYLLFEVDRVHELVLHELGHKIYQIQCLQCSNNDR